MDKQYKLKISTILRSAARVAADCETWRDNAINEAHPNTNLITVIDQFVAAYNELRMFNKIQNRLTDIIEDLNETKLESNSLYDTLLNTYTQQLVWLDRHLVGMYIDFTELYTIVRDIMRPNSVRVLEHG